MAAQGADDSMNRPTQTMPGKATPGELFARLEELGIESTTREHRPVYTVTESRELRGSLPGAHCKTLFFKDKKGRLWLAVVEESRELDLKALAELIGSARLSFARPERVRELLGVEPGAVTPFALINDTRTDISVVLDGALMENELVNLHPLVNDRTTTLRSRDLLHFLEACGHGCSITNLGPATRTPA